MIKLESLIKLYEESDNKVLSGQYIVDKLDIPEKEIEDFFVHFCLTKDLALRVNPGQHDMSLDWCLNNYELKKELNREVILNKLGL